MTNWYQLDSAEVFDKLHTTAAGLSSAEAAALISSYGLNRLTEAKPVNPIIRFLLQFHNLLIYVLLAAGCITAALGEWVDSGVIFGVVIINAVIGYLQEARAEQALGANML